MTSGRLDALNTGYKFHLLAGCAPVAWYEFVFAKLVAVIAYRDHS